MALPRISEYFKKFDWIIFGSSVGLVVFGLIVLYSTSLGVAGAPGAGEAAVPAAGDFGNFWKQAVFAAAGLVIVLALPAFNYRLLGGLAKPLYALSLVLLGAVLLFGRTIRGTTGWFGIGGFGIQPVEIVKFFLVVFLAKYFSDYARDRRTGRPIIGSGLAFAAVFILVALQPDFGSALLLFTIWLALLLMAGVRRSHLAAILIVCAVAAAVAWLFVLKPYQRDRVTAFLDPNGDPLGRGYNVTQSIIAIGSGGLTGKGLGYGSQSQLRFLPERQTDFIFAAAAEELGWFGVIFVFILFGVFFYQGYLLARAARDDFSLFLILGILTALAAEFVINIGGNLRLLPVTGVTLPFLSYGGSSLLAKFLMVGILESIAVRR